MATRKRVTSKKKRAAYRSSGVDLTSIASSKKATKNRVSGIRKERRKRFVGKDLEHIDWKEVQPGWFDEIRPDSPEWNHVRELLERPKTSRERRNLLDVLSKEVGRIYRHYRRHAERRDLKRPANYELTRGDTKHLKLTAERCVARGVHPKEHIMYWDKNVSSFTTMKWPTLAFISSSSTIDTTVSSLAAKRLGRWSKREKNSFSEVGTLDPELRRALEEAGFDTQEMNDRYLVSIEGMARARAKGGRMFISGKIREMVIWLAENHYS